MESNDPDEQQHKDGTQIPESPISEHQDYLSIPVDMIVPLVVDLWKIAERAKLEPTTARVLVACERAEERLKRIGFEIEEMAGRPYDTNMRVNVVEHDGGKEPLSISECLSPAIYYKGALIRKAEVITKGV